MLIVSTILLLIMFLISRTFSRSAFALDTFFLLFQFLFFSACLIAVPHYQYSSQGLVYAMICAFAWLLGSLSTAMMPTVTGNRDNGPFIACSIRLLLLLSAPALAVFGQKILTGSAVGLSIADLARANASARYDGTGGQTLVESVLVSFAFIGCILSGRDFLLRKLTKRIASLAPLATLFLVATVQDSKASITYALCLFFAGMLLHFSRGGDLKVTPKRAIAIGMTIILTSQVFGTMQNIRYNGALDRSGIMSVLNVYAFGGLSGFTIWHSNYRPEMEPLGLGAHSLEAIHERLTSKDVETGNNLFAISDRFTTTINTLLGLMVRDFGPSLVVCIAFFSGLLAGIVRSKCSSGSSFWATLAVTIYALTIFSPFTSLLNYASVLLALLLFGSISSVQRLQRSLSNSSTRSKQYVQR